ncbi:hypothetical protein BGZ63DRAFT_247452 [Mariannaea sp. PMI_226]|nr:hypothetical protein BGZ63DRAFT_247452 [Mariannaea sp. PMI_226]
MATTNGAHDLLIVLDATGSMGSFVLALNKSLPEIISLSTLTGCFERIGVITYRDYCGGDLTEWSGWCSPSGESSDPDIVDQQDVLKMAGNINADWGGDWPEATKTGLARAYENMREDATTIILLYTDAPPHFKATGGSNYTKEKTNLSKADSFSGFGPNFADWTSAAMTLKSGRKRGVVFSVVSNDNTSSYTPYLYLSTITGGVHFTIDNFNSNTISQLTLGILLTWMGAGKAVEGDESKVGKVKWYKEMKDLEQAVKEEDKVLNKYLSMGLDGSTFAAAEKNIEGQAVSIKDMPTVLKARGPSVKNFAKRYTEDENYKKLAVEQLHRIIQSDVTTVSINPIFGTLWRTVCNDRSNEARDGLITEFSRQVDRIAHPTEKGRMKAWLEESYNYKAEIQAQIAKVPAEERFPLVFLDPTADFGNAGLDEDDEDNRPLNQFTRGELLEISRSCNPRILRRLGRVLTQMTYVEKPEDMPAHIKDADANDVPQIPMALTHHKYKRQFWKILLHAILPGTLITARPAAVLAALALRMGIAPLRDAADRELMHYRGRWNTINIPETWNVGCLGLLLDADQDFEKRVAEGITKRETPESIILKPEDRRLFKTLVDYRMLELNLKTTLQAKVGWKPQKTKVALGPVVVCKGCQLPRSVTMMGDKGLCGLCSLERDCNCAACTKSPDYSEHLHCNVSHDHNENSLGYWVECSSEECRAQYVVYNPDGLNVRPKCFYCRHKNSQVSKGVAPFVECHKCLNRVIWPKEYRPKHLNLDEFECSACASDVVTIITQDTTAEALRNTNGSSWLLKNDDDAILEVFNGRSLFYTASNCDLDNLSEKVDILPANTVIELRLDGKLIRNQPEVIDSLKNWVGSRRAEFGVCSLCFSNVRKSDLLRACGRAGCHQLICAGCTKAWYGINARGQVINVAALSCAFCRRLPTAGTVSQFGLPHLGDLRNAIDDAGSWVYAWCYRCGFAKRHTERACAAGAPTDVTEWNCEDCEADIEAEAIAALELRAAQEANAARELERLRANRRGNLGPKLVNVMECPGCSVTIERVGGCFAMRCSNCNTSFCFLCGEAEKEEMPVYRHIGMFHHGAYDDFDDE